VIDHVLHIANALVELSLIEVTPCEIAIESDKWRIALL